MLNDLAGFFGSLLRGKRGRETVTSEWVAERWAQAFYAPEIVRDVGQRHGWSPASPEPFLALAALKLLGFSLGIQQKSVAAKLAPSLRKMITDKYAAELAHKYYEYTANPECGSHDFIMRLLALGGRLSDTFFANVHDGDTERPPPHWFAAKELCLFLLGGDGVPNPGEMMTYVEWLSGEVRSTKELFDELLAAGVDIVA